MVEPQALVEARRSLAEAEAGLDSADGLAQLTEGLALLDDVMGEGPPATERTARNLASAYATRVYQHVADGLNDRDVPEPALEHYFKLVLAFDRVSAAVTAAAQARPGSRSSCSTPATAGTTWSTMSPPGPTRLRNRHSSTSRHSRLSKARVRRR